MPDPNPANHPDNIPATPINVHFTGRTSKEINIGMTWTATRAGRVPEGTHTYVVPYSKEYEGVENLSKLLEIFSRSTPMFSPQPACRVIAISQIPELGLNASDNQPLQPNTQYIIASAAVNEAGRSEFVGNFDKESGIIMPIWTLEGEDG